MMHCYLPGGAHVETVDVIPVLSWRVKEDVVSQKNAWYIGLTQGSCSVHHLGRSQPMMC